MRNMLRSLATLLLLFLIASVTSSQIVLQTSIPLVDRSRHMIIVAVRQTPSGTYVGVSADLYVRVLCPGEGHVYVETMPLSELDTQASARVAAMVASMVAGIAFTSCDYFVSIRADTPIIGGPSASAAMAVAFAAALLNMPLNQSVVMTGMIMPDGSIGPVGGVPDKLVAAAKRGAKVFLVPYGQTKAIKYVVEIQRGPGYIKKVIRPKVVDLRELGRKLGIEVIPVATVYDALSIATNGLYKPPRPLPLANISRIYLSRVQSVLESWISDEVTRLSNVMSVSTELLQRVGASLYLMSFVREVNKTIETTVENAKSLEKQGLLYAAASSYFQALVYAKWLYYTLKLYSEPKSFSNIVDALNMSVHKVLSEIHGKLSGSSIDLEHLSILLGATSRAYEALFHLADAKTSWSQGSLIDTSRSLAIADARLRTAEMWLELLEVVNRSGIEIPISRLSYVSMAVAALARDTVSYVYALQLGSQEQLSEAFARFHIAINNSNPIDRLALALDAYGLAYSALITALVEENFGAVLGALNKTSTYLLTQLYDVGALPLSALLYMELVTVLKGSPQSQSYILSKLNTELASYIDMVLLTMGTAPLSSESSARSTVTKVATVTVIKTITATRTLYHTVTSTTTSITTSISTSYRVSTITVAKPTTVTLIQRETKNLLLGAIAAIAIVLAIALTILVRRRHVV